MPKALSVFSRKRSECDRGQKHSFAFERAGDAQHKEKEREGETRTKEDERKREEWGRTWAAF